MDEKTNEVLYKMKRPETLSDIINDQYFIEQVYFQVNKIITQRKLRPIPKPGYHYIRNIIDVFDETDRLFPEYFLDHIEDIWTKKSNLPANDRGLITLVCNVCVRATIAHYTKLETP